MKKELNELTEQQAREICSIVGKEFASFKCEESPIKMEKYACDIFFIDKKFLRIFNSGFVILVDENYKPLPSANWSVIDVVDYLRSEGFNITNKFTKNFLELIKSGKREKTEEMSFSREGFSGYKLIDDPNLNFNLIEVNTKTGHPLKKVEEGIRIYRVLDGYGTFYIQENSIVENQISVEVKYDDVILIKAGDSYRYEKDLGYKLSLFEINIKYP